MWTEKPSEAPLEHEPFLVVRLAAGWRHDPESRTFRGPKDEHGETGVFDPTPDLAAGARIEPILPDLARAAPDSLSEPELELARTVHLFPGPGADLEALLEVIVEWTCVEKAYTPPQVALPQP